MYYITDQWHNILYQLAQARPHNVLHFLVVEQRRCAPYVPPTLLRLCPLFLQVSDEDSSDDES